MTSFLSRRPVRRLLAGLAAALLVAVLLTWAFTGWLQRGSDAVRALLPGTLADSSVERHWIGQTRTARYVAMGMQSMTGQAALAAATVRRDYREALLIERMLLPGVSFSGAVEVAYEVEYSFGFDLSPGSYRIEETPTGILLTVRPLRLLGAPAVRKMSNRPLAGGVFTDQQAQVLKLYESLPAKARQQGQALLDDPAVQALAEKQLVDTLAGFVAAQPGVGVVPRIRVAYAQPPAGVQ